MLCNHHRVYSNVRYNMQDAFHDYNGWSECISVMQSYIVNVISCL